MKKIWLTIMLICSLLVFTYQHSLAVDEAAEPSDSDSIAQAEVETETASFSNPAQAAHAANLSAEASAAFDDDVENATNNLGIAEGERDEAQDELNFARRGVVTYEKEVEEVETNRANAMSYQTNLISTYRALSEPTEAQETRFNNALNQATEDVVEAQRALDIAEKNLATATGKRGVAKDAMDAAEAELATAETAFDEVMGELAGVSEKAISDMRDSKMGWGQIAHELGVNPTAIGLGKIKGYTNWHKENKRHRENIQIDLAGDLPAPEDEIAEATKRDIQHGWNNKGHGMATSVASSGKKGLGLSETDLGIGSKGSKASRGNSGSKSSKSISTDSSKSNSKSSSASSSTGNSKSDRGSAGGPSDGNSNSGNSSSGASKSDRSSTGGPSNNDKSNNGNSGNDKSNSSDKANDKSNNGNSGKSK